MGNLGEWGNGENEKSEKGTPTSVWSRKRKKEHACYGTSCNRRVRLLRSSWWPLRSRISVGSAVPPLSISWTAPHRITALPLFLILYKYINIDLDHRKKIERERVTGIVGALKIERARGRPTVTVTVAEDRLLWQREGKDRPWALCQESIAHQFIVAQRKSWLLIVSYCGLTLGALDGLSTAMWLEGRAQKQT